MFVLNPDPYLLPSYRLSPFNTEAVSINNSLLDNDFSVYYLNERFGIGNWQYTFNGREAIRLALESYDLDKNDLVTIITTSQNFYISSCVTKEIERFCRWNREIVPETKIIFVNHEFGYPYSEMEKLMDLGLPIIEDCCTTFFSQDSNKKIGLYGDFSVFSLPKFFPIQIGGLLVNNTNKTPDNSFELNAESIKYLQNVLSHQLQNLNELLLKRADNYEYARQLFSQLGFTLRFDHQETIVPYALVLNNNGVLKDLDALKLYLSNHGIQNSLFYGEDAFFIPVHQNLEPFDLDYFFACIQNFLKT